MLRHIVLMKCKPAIPQAEIDKVFAALAALQTKISGILAFAGGANNSPEGLAQGYTHGFTIDFADEQARAVYWPHPEHRKVVAQMQSILVESLDRVLVLDFEMSPLK
jgi:hypothetical protein